MSLQGRSLKGLFIKTNKLLKWSRRWIRQHTSFWTSTTHFGFV